MNFRNHFMGAHGFLLASFLLVGLFLVSAARAQDMLRAAAVVNDEIISVLDVQMRLKITLLSTGLKNTPEVRQRVLRRVLRALIDERLQAQEAKRLDIKVSEKDVDDAVAQLAQQNKMPADKFLNLLESKGILPEAIRDQVRAQLIWRALVARRLRPSIQISDEEVDEVVERIRANKGNTLWRIAEIVLSSDGDTPDEEIRSNADRLFEQIRAGADFAALARQFSESATAPRGGDLGWVSASQLPEDIAAVLEQMKPGSISRPIRALDGYHIVLLRDQRQSSAGEVMLDLHQVFFPLPQGADDEARRQTLAAATAARNKLNGCQDIDSVAQSLGGAGSGSLGTVKLSDLPGPINAAVARLAIGQPSEPVITPAGINVLVVCKRTETGVDRDRIKSQLLDERLGNDSRRYMRDLRRNANIDIRL